MHHGCLFPSGGNHRHRHTHVCRSESCLILGIAAQGRSGIRAIQSFDTGGLPVRFGGEIPDFDARNYIDKKERKNLRVMARTIQLAVAAAQCALDDSGVDKDQA